MEKINTIFIGSGNFAVKIFEGILKFEYLNITAVISQPSKPAGRDKKLTPCHLMQWIIENNINIKVFTPLKLKDEALEIISITKPELIIVADYGQMIPESIINYPKYKCINVHGSLLPDLKGAVPATIAILKGYTKTGVSIPIMTKGLDDGDIIASRELEILKNDNTNSLRMRLAKIGVELLYETLPLWFKGEITPKAQDKSKSTITKQSDIKKENAKIKADTDVLEAERMIRAFNPWPIAWVNVMINNNIKRIKIYEAIIVNNIDISSIEDNTFVKINKEIYLKLRNGLLKILKLQVEGKNIINSKDALFLNKTKIL